MPDNSSDNKRIVKNTIILYLRSIILILISLYSSRVVLQTLGVKDFGIYNIVGGVVAMFAMLNTSMSMASQRFISYTLGEDNDEKLKMVFSTSVVLHIILGLVVVFLVEIIGVWFLYHGLNIPQERLDVAFWVLQFSVASVFVNVNTIPYNAVLLAHEKMSALAYIVVLNGLLKLLAAISLFWVTADRLIVYAALIFLSSVLVWFVCCIYTHKNFEETRHLQFKLDHAQFKEMFSFAGWHLFGSSSNVLKKQGVDILLNMFFGVTVNAAKALSNQVFSAVELFVSNLQSAVSPQLTKSFARNDYDRVHVLIVQGSRISFFLVTLFSVPMIVSAPQVLSIWLVNVPVYTVEFVRWLFIYLLLDTFSRFLLRAVSAYGNIRNYQIVVGGTKLLIVPVAYIWLLLGGGPLVCIWSTLIVEIVCFGERLYFSRKYHGFPCLQYIKKVFLRCWIVFALAISTAFLLKTYLTSNFILITMLALGCSVIAILYVGVNSRERAWIKNRMYQYVGVTINRTTSDSTD